LLVDYLTRQKLRVTGVDGGIALRKLVERELPALVLLDVGLPGEDGFALGVEPPGPGGAPPSQGRPYSAR
jgi:DNA-binding response OmpR family regulator